MQIHRDTPLFFDASVLVAGSHSSKGGSALLLEACRAGGFRAQITLAVLVESLHALDMFPLKSQRRFDTWLAEIDWEYVPVPSAEVLSRYRQYIAQKDVHVLAAAIESHADFLLTLDRRHILAAAEAVKQAKLPITILRPGDFIRAYYARHVDYRSLPAARDGEG